MADGFNGCYDIRCYFYSFNINKPARKIINSIPIELKWLLEQVLVYLLVLLV